MALHKTTVHWGEETYYWASLDGEDWYEVNQDFGPERETEIRQLFADRERAQWKPLCFKTRYLNGMKHDPKIQSVQIEQLV